MMMPAMIFARAGSKRLPGKNLRMLGDLPLLAWSIRTAQSLKQVERIIVSTESMEIAEVAKQYGAEIPFLRPQELALDETPEWLVWKHALEALAGSGYHPTCFLSLPPTAPLRATSDVQACLELFMEKKADGVIGITPAQRHPAFNMVIQQASGQLQLAQASSGHIYRRQDAPAMFDITTVAYVMSSAFIMSQTHLFAGKIHGVLIPRERAVDIDDEIDLKFAEFLLRGKK